MGQKANVNTRRNDISLHFTNNTKKKTLIFVKVLDLIKKLLKKKGVLVLNSFINNIQNKIFITLDVFYTTKKCNKYKKCRKIIKKKKEGLFLKKLFKLLNINLIFLKISNLNKQINKKQLKKSYRELKKYSNLFEKQKNFFLDFIKITALFRENKLKMEFYIILVGALFSFLKKKSHNQFFQFLEFLCEKVIDNRKLKIIGIKTLISGKIQGKTRSSSKIILKGKMPIQSIKENINFDKTHIHTVYGAFGLKMWVYKKI